MKKIYYPDYKQKKECMKKIVKGAPEYKGIKIKIWILAVLCPISGFIILARLMLNPNYWILVNEGPGNFYIFIATMLFVMCPIFAYGVWNKRFYKCCEHFYMRKDKMVELWENGITFVYHPYDSHNTASGEFQDRNKNLMMEIKYPFVVIQKMQYDQEMQILKLTGNGDMQRYWDYEMKIKDEGPCRKLKENDTLEFLLYFDERNKLLDYLYQNIKDTVKEPIEKNW